MMFFFLFNQQLFVLLLDLIEKLLTQIRFWSHILYLVRTPIGFESKVFELKLVLHTYDLILLLKYV